MLCEDIYFSVTNHSGTRKNKKFWSRKSSWPICV